MVKEDRHGISHSDLTTFKRAFEKHETPTEEYLSDQECGIKTESEMRFENEDRVTKELLFWFTSLLILYAMKLYSLNN